MDEKQVCKELVLKSWYEACIVRELTKSFSNKVLPPSFGDTKLPDKFDEDFMESLKEEVSEEAGGGLDLWKYGQGVEGL